MHLQGRYTDAIKVLDSVRQQDASVVQVSLQKGRVILVVTAYLLLPILLTLTFIALGPCLTVYISHQRHCVPANSLSYRVVHRSM